MVIEPQGIGAGGGGEGPVDRGLPSAFGIPFQVVLAILTDPEKFAAGILEAASEKGKTISENANAFCQENYSYERYLELVGQALKKTQQQ
jgi:hypothetical protein